MKINNSADYQRKFLEKFGDIEKVTLANTQEYRVRVDLGGDLEDSRRVEQALERSKHILNSCFEDTDIWLQIILWDDNALAVLKEAGLNPEAADKCIEWTESGDSLLCLHYERYSFEKIFVIILAIVNYDLAFDPSANITCYFVNFDKPMIVNIYDDRGCDIYSPKSDLVTFLSSNFSDWLIQ